MTDAVPPLLDWRPARFMVMVAHPDDADFGPAGTAARWIDAGSVGWLVCCTSGDQGSEDAELDPMVLAATREAEQRTAAGIVGYVGVTFLHQPDGALVNDLALRELLVREIRRFRPDAVVTHDPEVVIRTDRGINHTDHRAAGMAALDAVYPAARNPMVFPWLTKAGLVAHRVRRVYLFATNAPGVLVDTSATIDRKARALRAHASQVADMDGLERRMRARAAEEGAAIGVAAAERFRSVVIDPDPPIEEASTAEPPARAASGGAVSAG